MSSDVEKYSKRIGELVAEIAREIVGLAISSLEPGSSPAILLANIYGVALQTQIALNQSLLEGVTVAALKAGIQTKRIGPGATTVFDVPGPQQPPEKKTDQAGRYV